MCLRAGEVVRFDWQRLRNVENEFAARCEMRLVASSTPVRNSATVIAALTRSSSSAMPMLIAVRSRSDAMRTLVSRINLRATPGPQVSQRLVPRGRRQQSDRPKSLHSTTGAVAHHY